MRLPTSAAAVGTSGVDAPARIEKLDASLGVKTDEDELTIDIDRLSLRAAEPDIGIAIDTTLAVDTPGVPDEDRVTKQGDGVALTIADSLTISDRSLIDEFEAVAKKREIPFQLSILPKGGTDAGPMQRARGGFRTMTLSVPTRYIHTVTECIHKRDLQASIDLLAAWLEG